MTLPKPCTCKNDFQDSRYGKGVRMHNSCQKPAKPGFITAWRCTACGTEKAA